MSLTAAVSAERLKKFASNKPTSSFRKWPPMTFVLFTHQFLLLTKPGYESSVSTHPVQLLKVGVVKALNVEPVLGYLGPCAPALGQEVPQFSRAVDIAGEATAHANNGDGGV